MSNKTQTSRWETFKQPCVVFDLAKTGEYVVYADSDDVHLFSRRAHSEDEEIWELGPHKMPHGWLCGPGMPLIAPRTETAESSETPRVVVDIDDHNGGEFLVFPDKGVTVYIRFVDDSGEETYYDPPRNPIPNGWVDNFYGQQD